MTWSDQHGLGACDLMLTKGLLAILDNHVKSQSDPVFQAILESSEAVYSMMSRFPLTAILM